MRRKKDGTLPIKKKYKGVGRIYMRAGTKDRKVLKAMRAVLDKLYKQGRLTVLEDIRDMKVSLMEVYAADLAGQTKQFTTTIDIKPLNKANDDGTMSSPLLEWVDLHQIAAKTKIDYRNFFKRFLTFVPQDAMVSSLDASLRRMREAYQKSDKPVMFNRTRAAVRSYVSDTVGRYTDLYSKVSNIKPLNATTRRKGNHLTVAEVRDLMSHLPEPYRSMVWTMCITGMRALSEYFADVWEPVKHRRAIRIKGTKTVRSDRLIPRVEVGGPLFSASCQYRDFRKAVRKASGRKVLPSDFRKTFVHWMELAGVPRSNRKAYMSHAKSDTTDIYELHEISAHLKEDGERLTSYIKGKLCGVPNPNAVKFFEVA